VARLNSRKKLLLILPLSLACGGSSGSEGENGSEASTQDDSGANSTSQGTESQGSDDSTAGDDSPEPDLPGPQDPVTTVAESLVPFDVNREDLAGPGSWDTNYGKTPELIAVPEGNGFAVFAQNYDTEGVNKSVLLHLDPSVDDYVITGITEPPFLDRIMGLDHDAAGTIFVASGIIDSDIDETYPAPGEYRSGIVSVVSTDWDGTVNFDIDLDLAREAFDGPELLVNPMVAASARLAYGANTIAVVHGNNTDPDPDLNGTRHQKAVTTHLDASSGAISRSSSIWVSHSFDQRMLFDGQGFIEMHHGDAFPRHVAFARIGPGNSDGDSGEVPLFHIKGDLGDNVTRTQIGDVARIENDPDYGYLAVFIAERSSGTDNIVPQQDRIAGTREIAVVRIKQAFEEDGGDELNHLDPALPDTLDVTSSGTPRTNRLRWITNYDDEGPAQALAERAKLVAIGGDAFIVMWERHELGADGYSFAGSFAATLDQQGQIVAGPEQVSDSRLPRGDDAFPLEGGGAFLTGDSELRELHLHIVDADLATRVVVIE
jgi:hypothetical protein